MVIMFNCMKIIATIWSQEQQVQYHFALQETAKVATIFIALLLEGDSTGTYGSCSQFPLRSLRGCIKWLEKDSRRERDYSHLNVILASLLMTQYPMHQQQSWKNFNSFMQGCN